MREVAPTYPVAEIRKTVEDIAKTLNLVIKEHGPHACMDILVNLVNNATYSLGIGRDQFVDALDYSISKRGET